MANINAKVLVYAFFLFSIFGPSIRAILIEPTPIIKAILIGSIKIAFMINNKTTQVTKYDTIMSNIAEVRNIKLFDD